MVLDWHYYVAFLTGYLTHPRTPMAMGTSAAATSATDGFAARECLVWLAGRAGNPTHSAAAVIDFAFFLLARQRACKPAFCSCFVRQFPFRTALRCVIDSATPAVQDGLLTAGAGAHPARCTGIGLVLRPQPDPDVTQARCSILDCPATPTSRLALTMTPLILCLHFITSAPRCFRCAQGYQCCEPWAHSSLCRHSALPCLRFTAHRHRLCNNIRNI